jgi:hypothetical protein
MKASVSPPFVLTSTASLLHQKLSAAQAAARGNRLLRTARATPVISFNARRVPFRDIC